MTPLQTKLKRMTTANWRHVSLAYLYLIWAGWRLFVRKEKLDRWGMNGERPRTGRLLTEDERLILARQARWVSVAARHPVSWARCLQRSLALCLWLERQDLQPDLKIGVRKDGVVLEAHAWVEYSGEVLNDRPDVSREFAPLTGANMASTAARWAVKGR